MSTCVIVMSKVPQPGKTKSRLQEKAGEQAAALFHRACLYDLQSVLRTCGMASRIYIAGGSREEFCAPFPYELPKECRELSQLDWSGFSLLEQKGRNLGDRMFCAVQETLKAFRQVIVIGSDIPGIDQALLQQARAELDRHDLVLGPALDGGYYLIGLKRAAPFLFQGMDWGTDQVLKQTLQAARRHQLRTELLPMLQDIDRWQDLEAWIAQGKGGREKSPMAWRFARYLLLSDRKVLA